MRGHTGKGIVHSLSLECVLEFGTHERVSVARVSEDRKVDPEYGHVEEQRYKDETSGTSKEMPMRELVINAEKQHTIAYLIHSEGLTLASPNNVQSCLIVENPTVATVKKPTHLQEETAPSANPVSPR